ncbi:MAG: glycosyltransferase [Candidatus Moranbacteria bacterium]|nr:glycosyltransferase [Candidatus Moranbacteria bacterium]
MRFSDIFRKIKNLFKKRDDKKKDCSIRTVDIRFSNIPYSIYLVIKKYGWIVFFRKSAIILKKYPYRKKSTYIKGRIKGFFQKYPKKIKYLFDAAYTTYQKEGFTNTAKRSFNYIRYGKGVLKKKETKREELKISLNNKYRIIAENLKIDELDIKKINDLVFERCDKPEVSIIIPVFNKWQHTYNCLVSLKENIGKDISFEIIVIDNASADETPQLFEKIKNVNYVRNIENLNFVIGNNQGIEKSRGKYIVCLNNDTYVFPGWLESLLATVKSDEKIGLVGSKLIYPDGQLQESGGIVWKNKKCANYGKFHDPDSYEFNYLKDVDYCSAASIIVRRDVFRKLGGFDAIYRPAYFEDVDLAFRVRGKGFRAVYQPKSELIHFEGVTAGKDTQDKKSFKKYQEINKEKFFERWKDVLAKENFNDFENKVFLARDRSKNKKVMLYMDNNVPTHDQDAGSFVTFEYLKIFLNLGYKIVFWPHNMQKLEPYVETLQQMGIETVFGSISFEQFIRKNGKFIDLALLARPHVASDFIDLIYENTKAKIIYSTIDLHHLREKREYEVGKANGVLELPDWKKTKELEIELMEKSDVSLLFSSEEEKIINKEFPEISVETIPWIQKVNFSDGQKEYERRGILFLGGFSHAPNTDAVIWFHDKIFPLIKKDLPGIEVAIAGSNPPQEIMKLNSDDFEIKGFVPDEDLPSFFGRHKVFVAPLRYGAGFKGKIAMAMSYGLPVVTTSIGAEGMGLEDGETAMIADSAEDLAKKIINLYNSENDWKKIADNSIRHVAENYSAEAAQKKFTEIVGKIGHC